MSDRTENDPPRPALAGVRTAAHAALLLLPLLTLSIGCDPSPKEPAPPPSSESDPPISSSSSPSGSHTVFADEKPPNARDVTFAFWNLENLFDTADDPTNPGDDEYLPGEGWTDERYARKLDHLATAVAALDADLLGVCEVENRRVLEDLIAHPALADAGYAIAHRDSPDKRGIDLGLLHRAPFTVAEIDRAIHNWEIDLGAGVPKTRGILEVNLVAHGHPLIVLVNHWPSRSGGEERSLPHRIAAAKTARNIVLARLDAARNDGREGDVLLVGDFNDDPFDDSLVEHLEAVRGKFALEGDRGRARLFNPSWSILATPDLGTLYYRAGWNVFDQAIVSRGMLDERGFSYVEGSLAVVDRLELRNQNHPGKPPRWFREYRGNWDEGYSDHFAIRGTLRLHTTTGE